MTAASYEEFLRAKTDIRAAVGIPDPPDLNRHLFPFQVDLARWALRRGRAALFADTGLGKTLMQAAWADVVSRVAGPTLILAPLAVAEQTVDEAARFGIGVRYRRDQGGACGPITITNYEMLHRFEPNRFAGVVLDESSILKAYDGATRTAIIQAFADTPFRLACTATPAPNDFTELGNHAEFLGISTRAEMLARYFVHDGGSTADWRLKGHAVEPFWRWVSSWGAMVKRPSDLGYSDDGFELPELRMHERVVGVDHEALASEGYLFAPTAVSLSDQRATRRATMSGRVAEAVRIYHEEPESAIVVWCDLNAEADTVTSAIPGAVQVAGADDPETKRDRLVAFAEGAFKVLVTKTSIAGFGMNWQHCHRSVFMGASHSYEGTYQAIRRFWRYGQTRPVDIYVIRAENEGAIIANYRRKAADAERMAEEAAARVRRVLRQEIASAGREYAAYEPNLTLTIPGWLR